MDFQGFNMFNLPKDPAVKKVFLMKEGRIRYFRCLVTGVFVLLVPAAWKSVRAIPAAGPLPVTAAMVQDTLHQGIEGTVIRVGGNHMPDPHHPTGPPAGVRSTVYIFELTNIGQVIRQGSSPYYSSIGTRFVKRAETDEKGHFRAGLAPGTYSLFTKKGELYYATRMDDKNNIAPVEVLPGKITPVECRVESDHKAVY
jgi:hypothetical protein